MEKLTLSVPELRNSSTLSVMMRKSAPPEPVVLAGVEGRDGRPMEESPELYKGRFATLLAEYREVFRGGDLNRRSIRIYWGKCKPFPFRLLERALDRYVEHSSFFPTVHELLDAIEDTREQFDHFYPSDEILTPPPDPNCSCLHGWIFSEVKRHGQQYRISHPCPRCVLGKHLKRKYGGQ